MAFADRHVVLGVSGGIACYKSCTLARRLTQSGAQVDVVLTAGAAAFVRPVTFEALTGRPVLTSLWERSSALAHIGLAKQADLVIVAPATAHLLARAAQGMADDLLTALLLARDGPVLCAPAMNDAMYAHPATRANLKTLAERGWHFVGPESGALAEGPSDLPGRMSEPETIAVAAARLLAGTGPLRGKTVLVTAGPTREHLDPVRVITNPSSVKLEPTPDILSSLERPPHCIVVGFALETGGDGVAQARRKLQDKALDLAILNDALEPGAGFEVATNRVTIVRKSGAPTELPLLSKRDVAERILDEVEQTLS